MPFGRVEKVALLAICVSILLVAIKSFLAYISGSVAIIADAWHSVADVMISLLVLASAVITGRKWKHASIIENIVALFIAVIILAGALFLVMDSLSANKPEPINYLPVVLIGAVICAAISRLIGMYEIKVGRREDSPAMIADGRHSIMDVYTTLVVIVGLLGHLIGLRLDLIAALMVVLFIVELGLEVAFLGVTGLVRKKAFTEQNKGRAHNLFRKIKILSQKLIKLVTGKEVAVSARVFAEKLTLYKKHIKAFSFIIITAVYFLSGFYTVNAHQTALTTLFGKVNSDWAEPGLHYVLPFPMGKVHKVDTTFVHRLEIGFRTAESGFDNGISVSRSAFEWHSLHKSGRYRKMIDEAIMLSGDENLIDINAVIKYSVTDPKTFLFNFENQVGLIRGFSENVMRVIVGATPIDILLSGLRSDIEKQTVALLQAQVDQINLGIKIISVELQDVHPPVEVVRAFRDVASAKEEKSLLINNAMADHNQRIPAARAKAVKMIQEAEGYKMSKDDHATGEGSRFIDLAKEYGDAKGVTSFRLYIQAMEKSLAKRRKYIVSPTLEPGALDLRIFSRKKSIKKTDVKTQTE